ncbi:YqgE/AlgH family protein [Escherichia coli]|nr:YqgE/AlgH family protein [Escherichia coli]
MVYIAKHNTNGAMGSIVNKPWKISKLKGSEKLKITAGAACMNQSSWIKRLCSAAHWLKIAGLFAYPPSNLLPAFAFQTTRVMTTSRDVAGNGSAPINNRLTYWWLWLCSWEKGQLEQDSR